MGGLEGPPKPPALGRAPAEPWRASTAQCDPGGPDGPPKLGNHEAPAAEARDVRAGGGHHGFADRDRGAEPGLHASRSAEDVDHRAPPGTVRAASVRDRSVRP